MDISVEEDSRLGIPAITAPEMDALNWSALE